MAASKRSLSLRVTLWVVPYMLVLTAAVVALGNTINEHAERIVWKSMLHSKSTIFDRRRAVDPATAGATSTARRCTAWAATSPCRRSWRASSRACDDVSVDGRERVLLVRMLEGRPQVLMMDLGEFERNEFKASAAMLAGLALALALLGAGLGWALRRLVRPLSRRWPPTSNACARTMPAAHRAAANASSEMLVIANALNDYLARNERYVDRERQFIATSSHELRTPMAVIAGAAELALDGEPVPEGARRQIERILRTARGVEQLIALLLVLARDPARLPAISETFRLDAMLPELVEDHRHLCAGRTSSGDRAIAGVHAARARGHRPRRDRQPAAQCHREQRPRHDHARARRARSGGHRDPATA